MVEYISFKNEKFNVERKWNATEIIDPCPSELRKTTAANIEELRNFSRCLPVTCGFVHLLSNPFEVPNSDQDSLPLIPRSVKANINHQILKITLPPYFECLQNFGKSFIVEITPTDL